MTFGLPVTAPSGTLAVTRRLVAATGSAAIRPRRRAEETFETWPQVAAAHLDLGAGGRLVDAAALGDADDVRDLGRLGRGDPAARGEGQARAHRQRCAHDCRGYRWSPSAPSRRHSLGPQTEFSLSQACGVSCRARAERAALRTLVVRFAPRTAFDTVPLVPPLRCGWAASNSAGHLGGGSIARLTAGWMKR